MYTLCDSEVVSPGCYDASLVSHPTNRTMGSLSAITAGISLRDYVTKAGLCFCAFGYTLLVRDFDASAVSLAGQEERQA